MAKKATYQVAYAFKGYTAECFYDVKAKNAIKAIQATYDYLYDVDGASPGDVIIREVYCI